MVVVAVEVGAHPSFVAKVDLADGVVVDLDLTNPWEAGFGVVVDIDDAVPVDDR